MAAVSTSSPSNFSHLTQRSTSLNILQPQPRMAQLETLEAKMASIEVSLSTTPRRRKGGGSLGGSLGGSVPRLSSRPDVGVREIEGLRTALQDRETVIQSLRQQLGLGRIPRSPGVAPLTDSERPIAEQRLGRLKTDSENKRTSIRNIKSALERLDITDNIDVRIRQAELEYALGREELELLSVVEEAKTLQCRLERSQVQKQEQNSIFSLVRSGMQVSLQALQLSSDPERQRWSAGPRPGAPGLYVEWVMEGESLHRGDRILEVNGKLVTSRSREELTRLLGTARSADVVVLRARPTSPPRPSQSNSNSTLKADNLRLTHRISYLEEQVKELQTKDLLTTNKPGGAHVTSISITSPPASPPDGCIPGELEVFRRGSQVTTVLHGKINKPNHVTKTIISSSSNGSLKTNGYHIQGSIENMNQVNGSSRANSVANHRSESRTSHHSNGSRRHSHYPLHNGKSDNETNKTSESSYYKLGGYNHISSNNFNGTIGADMQYGSNTNINNMGRNHYGSITADKQYSNNEVSNTTNQNHMERVNGNGTHNHGHTKNIPSRYTENGSHSIRHQNEIKQPYDEFNENRRNRRSVNTSRCIESADESRIVKEKSRRSRGVLEESNKQWDCRSSKSLELDSIDSCRSVDYTSEPLGSKRPAPPKKPLRLSLHRARSLQAVTNTSISMLEHTGELPNNQGKRPSKRTHHASSNRKRGEVV